MGYTNVWDVTQPPSTQAANQGAVDFQQTKLDIMQRVASFGAGLLANRPTPEATSGTANWTGVCYLATDTKQLFNWTGTAWVDISADIPGSVSSVRYSDLTPLSYAHPSANEPGNSISIPSGTLKIGSAITITSVMEMIGSGASDTASFEFLLDSTPINGSGNMLVVSANVLFSVNLVAKSLTNLVGVFVSTQNNFTDPITIAAISATVADISANPLVIATEVAAGAGPNTGTYDFQYLSMTGVV